MDHAQLTLTDDHWCFACGSQNPHGLHLADFCFEGDQYICHFTPERHHQGWAGITHGGIVATLLDEIMTRMLWKQGINAATGEITVRYYQPVKTGQLLTVRGHLGYKRGKLIKMEAKLALGDGTVVAAARAKLVQV